MADPSTDLRDRIAAVIFKNKLRNSHSIADAVLGVLGDLHADCVTKAEHEALRAAVTDAERAILGDGTSEADQRLHEALSPLWQALNDA